MITFKNFLTERVSDVIYHWTDLASGMKIIKDNKFSLTISSRDDFEKEIADKFGKGKKYYMSTARTRVSGFSGERLGDGGMNFVLSGRELSIKFMGRSIDYYGYFKFSSNKKEQEDRIFTNKKEIGNIQKYIQEVEIILSDEIIEYMDKKDLRGFIETLIRLSGQDIDYYIYSNIPDFKNKRKNKALTRKTKTREILKQKWSELKGVEYE